jgi:subtilisin family serine protease
MTIRWPHGRLLLGALLGTALITGIKAQQQPGEEFVPGELIVQFKENITEAERGAVRETYGTSVSRRYDTLRVERLSTPLNANPIALARAFTAHPEVEAAQPNFIRRQTSVGSPNDPYFIGGQLWGLPKISAPLAWSSFGTGSTDVVVADIDTGVNYNHPDLAANMWRNPGEIAGNGVDDDSNGYVDDVYGIDPANNDSNPLDIDGHGTHTSGTIGAVSDNGVGVAAVAPRVKILACRFIGASGTGSDADAIECFNYVVALKQRGVNVRVTSNSWGGLRDQFFPQALKNAIDAAGAAGIVNVFAAGNDGVNIDSTPFDPASFTSSSIVSVAASDSADAKASFSNYGAVSVDLAAPGVDILSTYKSGYAYASGTSMATPHVAGAAAMLLAYRPALTVGEVKNALLNSADLLGSWTGLVATGGRLNLFQTLQIASGGGGPVNVAAAASGATATASSSYGSGYLPGGANNGDRSGINWGTGGGWNDATANVHPDWLEIDFSGNKTISEIDVFTVQDAYSAPSTPTQTMTFTQYGVRDFDLQYWTGAAWQPIPNGAVTNNNLVWRQFSFAAITTSRIRVVVTGALGSYSRITEVEAWGTDAALGNAPPTVTLTGPANGATFTAPASITLAASASDADGTVNSVTFYANGSRIASDAANPYTIDWTGVPAGGYSLTAVALDDDGAATTSNPVSVTVNPAGSGGLVNVAATAAGATASASSSYNTGYAPGGANNGDRRGLNWGAGGGWNDATSGVYPDWLQVDFNGNKSISAIDVFTVQDAYSSPSEPTQATTFTLYGLRDFEAQYWNGTVWQTIPGTVVTNNNLVWRHFDFTTITTSRIRVLVTGALASYSRITEVEAWGTDAAPAGGGPVNVAAAAAGGVASATSSYSADYAPAGANDGDRRGVSWGAGGGWNDGTGGVYPDTLQIDFDGSKTISEVDVFTVQDTYWAPLVPTATMTFTQFGIRDFEVQYWNGSAWQTIPGTLINSNDLVWRRFTFASVTTPRIRVVVSNSLASYSRIVEVEAY